MMELFERFLLLNPTCSMAFTERRFKQIKELSFPYFSLFLPIHMFIVSNATETGKYSMISHILTNSNERLLWNVYF